MSRTSPKAVLFAEFAAVARALGHPQRLEILEMLAQGERSVEALAERLDLPVANVSQHLRLMRQAGLLASHRAGKHIYYAPSGPSVLALTGALQQVAERNLAQVREVLNGYFRKRDAMEPVSRKELTRRIKDDAVVVLDVRPADEFAAGHLPQALNIPLKALGRRLREIPQGREIVAYCRGPYCVLAFEAVSFLRKHGYEARRLDGGYPEWQNAGLPVLQGEAT
ncbi:MAG: ArsR family transcriptional regulator [Alphaproteobacteria bacterium]|nr:ArsR family transcriptional regulator [Alphaproteobacteria bacterium]